MFINSPTSDCCAIHDGELDRGPLHHHGIAQNDLPDVEVCPGDQAPTLVPDSVYALGATEFLAQTGKNCLTYAIAVRPLCWAPPSRKASAKVLSTLVLVQEII